MTAFGDFAAFVRTAGFLKVALWSGLGVGTITLVVLLRKRWRDASPLYKCTVFSVWSHALLIVYATSIQIVGERKGPGPGGDGAVGVRVRLSVDDEPAAKPTTTPRTKSIDPTIPRSATLTPPQPPKIEPKPAQAVRSPPKSEKPNTTETATAVPQLRQSPSAQLPASAKASIDDALVKWSKSLAPTALPDTKLALPSLDLPAPKPQVVEAVPMPAVASDMAALTPIAPMPIAPLKLDDQALPPIYQQRVATDRERIASAHGGSRETEAAVNHALKWLAANQSADGRWDASRFGAGRETQTLGQNRSGAGANADTAITGLALLALLGAGHTHQRGEYQATVTRGLDFLAASQHHDGNVGGNAEPFAFMYSHGMATLALSEALAMTNDQRLRPVVERAIGYTLRAQNRATGGWRYRPNESGDMSQMGWQLISLKSAELAGIEFPSETRRGIERFVASVSSGQGGGLASYRPQEQVSRPMTAEALVCRLFLGTPRQSPALDEAGNFLLGELPGAGHPNFYYWYYGTLGMYQLQGEHWRRWNDALTRQLLGSQTTTGEAAGSWEPNDVWGGHGGRVYSTALATLCLEVYYRYLPLYVEAAANGGDATRK